MCLIPPPLFKDGFSNLTWMASLKPLSNQQFSLAHKFGCPRMSALSSLSEGKLLILAPKRWLFCVGSLVCGVIVWFHQCIDPCIPLGTILHKQCSGLCLGFLSFGLVLWKLMLRKRNISGQHSKDVGSQMLSSCPASILGFFSPCLILEKVTWLQEYQLESNSLLANMELQGKAVCGHTWAKGSLSQWTSFTYQRGWQVMKTKSHLCH